MAGDGRDARHASDGRQRAAPIGPPSNKNVARAPQVFLLPYFYLCTGTCTCYSTAVGHMLPQRLAQAAAHSPCLMLRDKLTAKSLHVTRVYHRLARHPHRHPLHAVVVRLRIVLRGALHVAAHWSYSDRSTREYFRSRLQAPSDLQLDPRCSPNG